MLRAVCLSTHIMNVFVYKHTNRHGPVLNPRTVLNNLLPRRTCRMALRLHRNQWTKPEAARRTKSVAGLSLRWGIPQLTPTRSTSYQALGRRRTASLWTRNLKGGSDNGGSEALIHKPSNDGFEETSTSEAKRGIEHMLLTGMLSSRTIYETTSTTPKNPLEGPSRKHKSPLFLGFASNPLLEMGR